ncbi:glycosyltransferase [Ornithinimicrobium cerasi]|uniref:D-inositol 3-phosphate glycosyltransferase n=1 Tax=Ornithinimicrobium cerasi TaxID=2248773 RepID=A0A285VVK5_9MICO|nr:glycosyltransferase [Ornithinimicrobium cerasi]SOC58089.1 Glycosyltransferase involved in cell wall bisynthesis [Ornithinimicrobium cerasi]
MDDERYVAVGGRVDDPGVPALLGLAARYGVPVRAAALRPPARHGAGTDHGPADGADGLSWHQLRAPVEATSVLGGLVQNLTRRVLRGEAAEIGDALEADGWLEEALRGDTADAGTSGATYLVALDDASAQALARWRTRRGADLPVLTWDKAAERLADEAARLAAGAAPGTLPRSPGTLPRLPEDTAVSPGAMHRVAVAVPSGATPRERLRAVLPGLRARVLLVEPGHRVPAGTDVLVLDGLGPAVAQLPDLPGHLRVVHLSRPQDRSSPWRHLLPRDRLVVGPPGGELPDDRTTGDLVLGPEAAELVRLGRAGEDDAALRLVADRLDAGEQDPVLLREMVYLTRVTGAMTLERRVLLAMGAGSEGAGRTGARRALDEALDRVEDRLRETDPGWLPDLPATPVDPVPGRVLHLLKTTLPQRQAGYSVRGHHTLRALVDNGADVAALAVPEPSGDPAAGPPLPEEVVQDGVRYLLPAPVRAAGGTAYLQEAAAAVLEVVARERPAVLHVHSGHRGYDLGVVGAAVAAATGLPWVYEVRGLFESTWTQDPRRAERGETFARRMAREADLAGRADAVVTLAATMRADLVERGVPPEKVLVVPNAVDPEQLQPVERDLALARRYDAVGRFTFGYVSNLDHAREQVEDLVRAAVLLHSRGRPVLCLVVGSGSREQELRSLTEQLGAGGYVTFTGRVPHEEVAASYALLDVLVVPRSDERAARLVTPLKPFEAMAMGLPVVVSAQPALLEVVGDGERGWSYPAGDAAALADLLERLADDPGGRAEVAARARGWVTRERTWSGNAVRYAELYRALTGVA